MSGRPLKFPEPSDLQMAIDNYFARTIIEEHTLTGLVLSLDTTKETLDDYKVREGYEDIVKMAKLRIEHAYEVSLRKNSKSGDIFALKNFGWTDKQDVNLGNLNGEPFKVESNLRAEDAAALAHFKSKLEKKDA